MISKVTGFVAKHPKVFLVIGAVFTGLGLGLTLPEIMASVLAVVGL